MLFLSIGLLKTNVLWFAVIILLIEQWESKWWAKLLFVNCLKIIISYMLLDWNEFTDALLSRIDNSIDQDAKGNVLLKFNPIECEDKFINKFDYYLHNRWDQQFQQYKEYTYQ